MSLKKNGGLKKRARLLVALIVFGTVFFSAAVPEASATMYNYKLRCDTGTNIGTESTDFNCANIAPTTPFWTGFLNTTASGTTSGRIRSASVTSVNTVYAQLVNNTVYATDVLVTGYSASISEYTRNAGETMAGMYELGYYDPNGAAHNFVGLFNSTEGQTTSNTQTSVAISFNGQSGTIPAGNKLAVRVWVRTVGGNGQPAFFSYSTLAAANSSFDVDITPLTPTATYNISGYVTNKTSGLPLNGAIVQTNTSMATTTNASGFYNFTGLSNGTYMINASLTGYATNSTNVTVSGANVTNANISLTHVPTYLLSGYVINASNGAAISGATVTTNTSQTTTTNATGYYNFTASNGTYLITASMAGYSDNSTTRTVNGAAVGNVNIVLAPTPPVSGKILVATNRYVILDDPTTGTPDTGSGFSNMASADSWGTSN